MHAEDETTSEPCDIALQNCKLVVHSMEPVSVSGHAFGFEALQAACDAEYTAYLNEDGTGHRVQQVLTGSDCVRDPCDATVGGGSDPKANGPCSVGPKSGRHRKNSRWKPGFA